MTLLDKNERLVQSSALAAIEQLGRGVARKYAKIYVTGNSVKNVLGNFNEFLNFYLDYECDWSEDVKSKKMFKFSDKFARLANKRMMRKYQTCVENES